MSEQKPMKHEEYLAMGEENRRLRAEVEKLNEQRRRLGRERRRRLMRRVVGAVALAWPGIVIVFGTGGVVGLMSLAFPKADQNARKTTCYFVRHHLHESDDKRSMPWEPWHIFKSEREGGTNSTVTNNGPYGDPLSFDTKQQAWDFMTKWKLEACK